MLECPGFAGTFYMKSLLLSGLSSHKDNKLTAPAVLNRTKQPFISLCLPDVQET
jgi:hypothetical protein